MPTRAAQGGGRRCPRFARRHRAFARTPPGRAPTAGALCAAPADTLDAAVNKPEPTDPNAELRSFEPLRVVLALGALLLGLVMSIH